MYFEAYDCLYIGIYYIENVFVSMNTFSLRVFKVECVPVYKYFCPVFLSISVISVIHFRCMFLI